MPIFRGEAELSDLPAILGQHCSQVSGVTVQDAKALGKFRYILLDIRQAPYRGEDSTWYYEPIDLKELIVYDDSGNDLRPSITPMEGLYRDNPTLVQISNWPDNRMKLIDGDTSTSAVTVGRTQSGTSTTHYIRIFFDLGEPRYVSSAELVYSRGRGHTVYLWGLPEEYAYAAAPSVRPIIGVQLNSSPPTGGYHVVTPYYEVVFQPQQLVADGLVSMSLFAQSGTYYGPSRRVRYTLKAEPTYLLLLLSGLPYIASTSYNNVYFVGRAYGADGSLSGNVVAASTALPNFIGNSGRMLLASGASWAQPVSLYSTVARDLSQIHLQQFAYVSPSGSSLYFIPDLYLARISSGLVLDGEEVFARDGSRYLLVAHRMPSFTSYRNSFVESQLGDAFFAIKLQ